MTGKSESTKTEAGEGVVESELASHVYARFEVLRFLASLCRDGEETPLATINMIGDHMGIKDVREVQRILFVLEGKKLVVPSPPGNLTSRFWRITQTGRHLYESLRPRP